MKWKIQVLMCIKHDVDLVMNMVKDTSVMSMLAIILCRENKTINLMKLTSQTRNCFD